MKKKVLLPILLLATLTFGACTPGGQSDKKSEQEPASSEVTPSSQDATEYGVAIANKEALQAEWFVGDNRDLDITLTPAGNPLAELGKNLTATSSDPTVVAVTGLGLSAVGVGSATITVTYHGVTDSVELTIISNDPRVRYGTAHEGTAEDPFTNEDAVLVAEAAGTTATSSKYFVKGIVESFRDAPSSYGNVSFYFTPAQAGGKKFLAYRVKLGEAGTNVTADDIWIGGEAVVYCNMYNYNGNTPENSAGWLVSCTGDKQTIQNHQVNVAEAIAACKALGENGTSDGKDTYEVTGYIVAVSGSDFYLSDTKGAAAINSETQFQVYAYSGSNKAECTVGAKVKVACTLKYYKSSSSEKFAYETSVITSVTILEAGETVVVNNATIAEAITIINALEDNATSPDTYAIEGYIIAVTYKWSDSKKNLSYTLGATADATADLLTVYSSGAAEGTDGSALKAGDKVKVVGQLQKYVKSGTTTVTPEVVGGITTLLEAGQGGEGGDEGGGGQGQDTTNYGTQTEPLTIAQAKAIADAQLSAANSYTPSMLWVKAYVTNVPTVNGNYGWKNIYLGDSADAAQADCLLAYSVNKSDTCAKLAQNDFVLIHGALKNYSGTIEFTNVKDGDTTIHGYPEFSARVVGTSTITLGDHENATVSTLPASAANDTAITFTVTPADGYVVSTVKVNDKAITANEGQYSFELAGNSTIVVTTVAQGEGGSTEPQSGDFVPFTNDIVEGDYVLYFGGKAVKATIASNRLGYAELEPTNNFISSALAVKEVVWHIAKSGDVWTIYNADANKYMAGNGTKNQAALVDSVTDKATWTITKKDDGTFEIENVSNKAAGVNSLLRNNGTYGFATYAASTGGTLSLYQKKA